MCPVKYVRKQGYLCGFNGCKDVPVYNCSYMTGTKYGPMQKEIQSCKKHAVEFSKKHGCRMPDKQQSIPVKFVEL